jgi:mRNA interferase RelE/StbE
LKAPVRFAPEAARLVGHLPPEVKKLIRSAVDHLRENPLAGSELSAELQGYRSYKVRRYRIVYRLSESFLEVYHIGHRRNVYEALRSLLDSLTDE